MVTAAAALPFIVDRDRSRSGLSDGMTDLAAYERFVRRYQNMVFSVAVRILGNHADAEDIAQEVFLRAYQRFDELRHSEAAGGWLKAAATNLAINHLNRYRARWRFFSEEESMPEPVSPAEPAKDFREQIEFAIQKLPDAQRVPLVLFYFHGLSYEEIANRLGISVAKVKTDIHRARERLRRVWPKTDDA
ncbi:MAG: sigma-70 family RNA polymerase sigma factor [Verrucomicrobia bacterium]|nr:sigma-70 family RNA polymerase sigma factor [Verrucomicrobiota bacterium]